MEEGKIKGSVYFGPGSLGDDTNKTLINYLPEIDEINGDFICDINNITSLTQIHKKIKSINGYADFCCNNIQFEVLGLIKIKNLKAVFWCIPYDKKSNHASIIINKHLKNGRGVIDCQEELIDAGQKDYAEL